MKKIREDVCKDLKGEKRLEEKDGKVCATTSLKVCVLSEMLFKFVVFVLQVHLGGDYYVNAEMWKKHVRNAATDNKFINKMPTILWDPEELAQRTMTGGGRSGENKQKATPTKVACVICK